MYLDQYCSKCTTAMEDLNYCCDADYGINRKNVYNNNEEIIGKLVYCPNCGEIKVNLKRD